MTGKTFHVIGIMSGSSLDGLDIAYCTITLDVINSFKILATATVAYNAEQKLFFKNLPHDIHHNYQKEDIYFGALIGNEINVFIRQFDIKQIDFIASHGHTVFHYPAQGKTGQIGNNQTIANITQLPTITNFRQADIDAGGQGAPLVPLCDELFFGDYDACLNIGGIANISFLAAQGRIGFDICGANQLLNYLAGKVNLPFDEDGELAALGAVNQALLTELNNCSYFNLPFPKSLDNQFVTQYFINRLANADLPINDKLATVSYHIAFQIAAIINRHKKNNLADYRVLATGGGAYNKHLIHQIEQLAAITIVRASDQLIQYKEALAMCLMGALKWTHQPNFLPSVTGAKFKVSGGEIALPNKRN